MNVTPILRSDRMKLSLDQEATAVSLKEYDLEKKTKYKIAKTLEQPMFNNKED